MDTIKLIAPEGSTSASVDGVQHDVAEDGTVTVPASHALQLYGFGFVNAPAAEGEGAEVAAKAPASRKAKAPAAEGEAKA